MPVLVQQNMFQALGLYAVCVYILSSYINDFMLLTLHLKPFVSMVTGVVVFLCFVGSGTALRASKHKIGRFWFYLMIMMILAVPFSHWIGGSLVMIQNYVPKAHAILFYMCAFALTMANVRKMLLAFSCGGFMLLFMCFAYGSAGTEGRFAITDSLNFDANDLALHLCIQLAIFTYLMLDRNWLIKILGAGGAALAFLYILKTGSRGSLVTITVAYLACVFFTHYRWKLLLLSVPVVVMMIISPPRALQRLTYTFASVADESGDAESREKAIGSSMERSKMLQVSLGYTFRYPIFGVGPGQFGNTYWGELKKLGESAPGLGTHNSYTQVSSELGLISFFFYFGVIVMSIRTSYRLYRDSSETPGREETRKIGFCLFIMTLAYAVNTIFFHAAFQPLLSILAGFVTCANLAYAPERRRVPGFVPMGWSPRTSMFPMRSRG